MAGFFNFNRFDLAKSVGADSWAGQRSARMLTEALGAWKPPTAGHLIGGKGIGVSAALLDQYKPALIKGGPFGPDGAFSHQIAASARAAFVDQGVGRQLSQSVLESVGGAKRFGKASNLLGPRDSSARLLQQLGVSRSLGAPGAEPIARWKPPTAGHLIGGKGIGVSAALLDQYKPALIKGGPFGPDGAFSHQIAASARAAFVDQGVGRQLSQSVLRLLAEGFPSSLLSGRLVPSLFDRMDRVERELKESDPACARLSVLLEQVGVGRALALMERMLAEGSAPLLEVLGDVLLSAEALGTFTEVVRSADLPVLVEGDLIHALEHLLEEEADHALPPLLNGLEGALRDAAIKRGDSRRRPNARSLAAALKMKKDHELLVATIYDRTNDGRHGAELDRKEACVLVLVGLVLWMTECCDEPGTKWLGREVDKRLSIPSSVVR
jgi:hypothetical protein